MKYTLILENEGWVNVTIACELCDVRRSGYYYWKANSDKRLAEKAAVDKLYRS